MTRNEYERRREKTLFLLFIKSDRKINMNIIQNRKSVYIGGRREVDFSQSRGV